MNAKGCFTAGIAMACLLAGPAAFSQAVPPKASPAVSAAAPVAPPATPVGPRSMLEQTPQAPIIHLDGGALTIEATNSSLRAILDDLGRRTGTRIDGLGHDERIFGVYGPGNPQQVLSALLDDSGYNFVISGRNPDGSPREIALTTRTAGVVVPAAAAPTQAAQEDDDSDAADTQAPQPLFTPPPQQAQPPGQPGNPQQAKTPAQMLQELQQLRQAQQPQTPQ
jgi:hypothetical protein